MTCRGSNVIHSSTSQFRSSATASMLLQVFPISFLDFSLHRSSPRSLHSVATGFFPNSRRSSSKLQNWYFSYHSLAHASTHSLTRSLTHPPFGFSSGVVKRFFLWHRFSRSCKTVDDFSTPCDCYNVLLFFSLTRGLCVRYDSATRRL